MVWPVQDAKARFSELLDASLRDGPQVVTRRGVEAAVLVPIEEWRRLTQAGPRRWSGPVPRAAEHQLSGYCWAVRNTVPSRSMPSAISAGLTPLYARRSVCSPPARTQSLPLT